MGLSWGNSLKNFQKSIKDTVKDTEKEMEKIMNQTGDVVKASAMKNTTSKSGRLRRGWRIQRKGKGSKRIDSIFNEVPYANIIENGSRKVPPRRMLMRAVRKGKVFLKRQLVKLQKRQSRRFK